MYRVPIRLDTMSDVKEFVAIAERLPQDAVLKITYGKGLFVNGKSFLGCMYSFAEFDELFVESNFDMGSKLDKFLK